MKIFESSIMSGVFDDSEETIQNFKDLMNKSNPDFDAKFSFIKMQEKAGRAHISAKINDDEFLIKYSSYVFDASVLIGFSAGMIDMKEYMPLFLFSAGTKAPLTFLKLRGDILS